MQAMFEALLPLIFVLLAADGHGQLPWYGPLAPVDDSRMVVSASCNRGETLTWSPALQRQAHGMEPGERVWLITHSGAVAVRLGRPVCYAGECGGDYAALELPRTAARDAIAVVPFRFLRARDTVRPLSVAEARDGPCADPPSLAWKAGSCRTFLLGERGRSLELQTETRSTETGWDMVRTHARVTTGVSAGVWRLLAETTAPLNPEALIVRNDSDHILWRQAVGIGGPANITLVFSRVESDGSLTFGRRYSAGGQPCD